MVALCVSMSNLTNELYPYWAARCNGVIPDLDLAFTYAFLHSNTSATWSCPFSAAKCKAAFP